MLNHLQNAKQWRDENGYTGKGGVIVYWGAIVQGWVYDLPEAKEWSPGCIAVSEDGARYLAVGGNGVEGAARWEALAEGVMENVVG